MKTIDARGLPHPLLQTPYIPDAGRNGIRFLWL